MTLGRKDRREIFVDADGCPVVDQVIRIAAQWRVPVTLICDTSHQLQRDGAATIVVSKGADSADYALVNRIGPGDIAVTQDYGLAAMCLARGARALNQDGMEYTSENIDGLLLFRHTARKIRNGGGRLKGAKKRDRKVQDKAFAEALEAMLQQNEEET